MTGEATLLGSDISRFAGHSRCIMKKKHQKRRTPRQSLGKTKRLSTTLDLTNRDEAKKEASALGHIHTPHTDLFQAP
jgi:hypothetical protein